MSYRDEPPRKMYDIKCSECGKDAQVPFKPDEGRPVYCQECYKSKRRNRSRRY